MCSLMNDEENQREERKVIKSDYKDCYINSNNNIINFYQ